MIQEKEENTQKFWKKNKIFEKSVENPAGLKKPKGNYVFYDGPPFITGLPHYGTILPSIIKDAIPRYWSMKGYKVERKWGWDCHGLPAENKVEKKLGLKNKKEIEELGIGNFVGECKNYVNDVSGQWNWYIDKIARWVDMDNSYRTMDKNFMESVLWAFKELYDKGLIYEGYRTSLHCPRCATPLSKFEVTMDSGSYRDITEMSVIVKFPVEFNNKKANLLVWTTTPWTLAGNLAIAINKKIKYVLVEIDKEYFIVAKEKAEEILKDKNYKIIEEFSGDKLQGLKYESVFDLKNKEINENDKTYKIYHADFVNTEEGTGIVHIAPNFGEDDFELGKEIGIPLKELMDENGIYTKEIGPDFNEEYFKDAGKKAIKKLDSENKLFSKFNVTHSYPHCYRCETQLIYRTQKAWYLDTDKIRKKMIKNNKKINWVPEHFKNGRFKYNLETAPHWCLSRSRYWGTPIPVWKCQDCEKIKVIGSVKEIEELSGKKVKELHLPDIDGHEFNCDEKGCSGKMKRIPEIFDCWFESGSMPFAQWHYPFERKEDFSKIFPADFITEYTGQLRGWFYYLHVLSNGLFDSEAFKNVVVTGVLWGNDGRKMSKSYGNYPDPKETIEKYGGDALRMYFLASPVISGGDMNISEKDIKDSLRKNVMLLYNVYNFYELIDKKNIKEVKSKDKLDLWIISRLYQTAKNITENLEKYDVPSATKPITGFIEDLSTWYLRLKREDLDDKNPEALSTLKYVLELLLKIIAPFMPFASEDIWQSLTENNFKNPEKSVHLEKWPELEKQKTDDELLKSMEIIREIVSKGLKERDQNKTGLRWPLKSAFVRYSKEIDKDFYDTIKSQLNIKEIKFEKTKNTEIEVKLDFSHDSELEKEGYAREFSRQVQAFRKKLGLNKQDKIELYYETSDEELKNILENKKEFIKERTNSVKFENKESVTTLKETFKNKDNFSIKDKRGMITIVSLNTTNK